MNKHKIRLTTFFLAEILSFVMVGYSIAYSEWVSVAIFTITAMTLAVITGKLIEKGVIRKYEEKIKLFDGFKNIISKIENLDDASYQSWKVIFIMLVVVDLMGIYWYLELKKLGLALLIVLLIFMAMFLFFSKEPKGGNKKCQEEEEKSLDIMEEQEEKKNDTNKKEDTKMFDLGDMGLPSSEEMNKRLDDALGF